MPKNPLVLLMDQLENGHCKLEDFKQSAPILVNQGADPKAQDNSWINNTLLHHLILKNEDGVNNKEITELLKLKPDLIDILNGRGYTPLQSLMNQFDRGCCKPEIFKQTAMLLANHGANLNAQSNNWDNNTLLHHLVLTNEDVVNNKEIAELLLLKKDLINIKNNRGSIPLHALLKCNSIVTIEVVDRLLQLGSDLHTQDATGKTLLHAACYSGNLSVAQYLVNKGLDIQAKTNLEETMLHCAASHQNKALWQWLYENKVNIDAKNNEGQTALHFAAQCNMDMFVWLILNKADRNLLDRKDRTALSIANEKQQDELAAMTLVARDDLGAPIHKMYEYGKLLKSQGSSKGQVAIDLALQLKLKVIETFKDGNAAVDLPKFKNEFSSLLNSKNKVMSEYRASWGTIVANIGIALTGIGAIAIVCKLFYSKATKGRSLFFFQNSKTTREEKVQAVRKSVSMLQA